MDEDQPRQTPTDRVAAITIVTARIAAILMAVFVVFVSAVEWREGRYPLGFPWSVLSLLGLSVLMATTPRPPLTGTTPLTGQLGPRVERVMRTARTGQPTWQAQPRWTLVLLAACLFFAIMWFVQGR